MKTLEGCGLQINQQIQKLMHLHCDDFEMDSYTDLNTILNHELHYDYYYLICAEKLLMGLVEAFKLPRPYIYPMADSDRISVEWDIVYGCGCVDLELDMVSRIAKVVVVVVLEKSYKEHTGYLKDPGEESLLGRFLADNILGEVK